MGIERKHSLLVSVCKHRLKSVAMDYPRKLEVAFKKYIVRISAQMIKKQVLTIARIVRR